MKRLNPVYSIFLQCARFAIVMIMLSAGCRKNETTVQAPPENLLDPSVWPRVTYTYPPAGGVGPFNVFSPPLNGCYLNDYAYCNIPGHFFLQFNKMIMSATMVSPNIRVTGGTKPIVVRLRGNNPSPLQNVFECVLSPPGDMYSAVAYQVGQVYTVTIDTGVVDGNGNHLMSPFSFSFTPEPWFRILHTLPASGDSIAANGRILMMFNSSVDSSVLTGIHLNPPVPGRWYFNDGYDSMLIAFYPTNGFFQESAYTLTLADDVHDKHGSIISGKKSIAFRTYPFQVASTYPESGTKLYGLYSSISIVFTGPVEPSSINYGMEISPLIPDMAVNGNYIYWNARDHDLIPSTTYSIRLNANLRSTDNTLLGSPYAFWFTTPPFGLQYATPNRDQQDVSKGTPILFHYSGRLDTSSIASSFSIDPPVRGHLSVENNAPTGFMFSPDTFYLVGMKYRAIVGTSLRSIDGYHSAHPDTIMFTVASGL